MASKAGRLHGRVEGAATQCAAPGCRAPGEFRAPLTPGDFDGPGSWRWLCLAHVREHNAAYNFFTGMTPEQIEAAQSPLAGWDRPTRIFSAPGADPAPAWADFADPLDAIATRFKAGRDGPCRARFTAGERKALGVLGLDERADLHSVRKRYSQLVRRYHPDRNGGDRSHEKDLSAVLAAWQKLKAARAFS